VYKNIDAFLLASAVYPRFKLKWVSPIECVQIKDKFVSMAVNHQTITLSHPQNPTLRLKPWSVLNHYHHGKKKKIENSFEC